MSDDRYDLGRFLSAQEDTYERALQELRAGVKQTHWMWFIFPQIMGLGYSSTSKHYSLKSTEEVEAFLAHPVLGARLRECTETILALEGRSALDIFGDIDETKLKSSMTLFSHLGDQRSLFIQVLDKYFAGELDYRTLEILEHL